MVIWQTFGSALIGLVMACAGLRWVPRRLPARPLVLATGPVAALFGCLLTHATLGPGHPAVPLAGALVVGVALLSLLIRPGAGTRSAAA